MRYSVDFSSMFFSVAPRVDRGCEARGVDSHSAFFYVSLTPSACNGAEGEQGALPPVDGVLLAAALMRLRKEIDQPLPREHV